VDSIANKVIGNVFIYAYLLTVTKPFSILLRRFSY